MKKFIIIFLLLVLFCSTLNARPITTSEPTGKTVLAGLCSLILWPGIGQAINNADEDKVISHALYGLIDVVIKFPLVRLWSGYDALVDRKGGYMDGRL